MDIQSASQQGAQATGGQPQRSLKFLGEGGTLFGLLLLNGILTVLTLGIYSFWGRVRLRQYVLRHTDLDGERFDYHGTGGELLVGFLKVFAVFFGLVLFLALGMRIAIAVGMPQMSSLFVLAMYGILIYLMPYAIVGAQRYQRSRTSWRGQRFSFTGTVEQLSVPFIKGVLLTAVTLGFYSPYFLNTMYAFSLNHTFYGSQRFSYDGDGDGLFKPYVKAFFLGLVTLGIYWIWYLAERSRYLAAHTSFGNVRFESTVTGGKLFSLAITNFLLILVTCGLAIPWVLVRTLRFQMENLVVAGTIPQQAAAGPLGPQPNATGDAMADALGIDGGLGL
jgi:uncharacterized membrane protein YjgN (DUF898 family)